MSIQGSKQPEIRFDKVDPTGLTGVSYLPKTIFVTKTVTAAGNDDFLVVPAKTFIKQVVATVLTAVNNSGTVTLGLDSDADAFITTTDFDASTAGNYAVSTGSTVAAGKAGLYLPAGDTLRIAVAGTCTEGSVAFMIEYYELGAMATRGAHLAR